MKTQKLAAVLLTLALSLGASQGALAHPDISCVAEVTYVGEVIQGTTSFISKGQPGKDKGRLLSKVEDALFKLRHHKPADAQKKLVNIRDKVTELRDARKMKIGYDDANIILTAVEYADSCLSAIR